MNRFFRKIGQYMERPYWADVGMFGEDWALLMAAEEQEKYYRRKVVYAPLREGGPQPRHGIRIKAMIDPDTPSICHFMVDRPIVRDYSARFGSSVEALDSPLALSLFEVGGIREVVLHESEVMVARDPAIDEDWRIMGREIGDRIRTHLLSDQPAVSPEFIRRIPSEDEIIERVQVVINDKINPLLARHDGDVLLDRIENNTIWINLGGSCQGCAEAPFTCRHDIAATLRQAVPELGAIYDATDHFAGVNPFFTTTADKEGHSHEAA